MDLHWGCSDTACIFQGLGAQFAPRPSILGLETSSCFFLLRGQKIHYPHPCPTARFGLHFSDWISLISVTIPYLTVFSEPFVMLVTLHWAVCPAKTLPPAPNVKFQVQPGWRGIQWDYYFPNPRRLTSSNTTHDDTGYIFSNYFSLPSAFGLVFKGHQNQG